MAFDLLESFAIPVCGFFLICRVIRRTMTLLWCARTIFLGLSVHLTPGVASFLILGGYDLFSFIMLCDSESVDHVSIRYTKMSTTLYNLLLETH